MRLLAGAAGDHVTAVTSPPTAVSHLSPTAVTHPAVRPDATGVVHTGHAAVGGRGVGEGLFGEATLAVEA